MDRALLGRRKEVRASALRLHPLCVALLSSSCVPIALSQTLDELPEELRSDPRLPVAPLFKQRRWARISWRYAVEYRKGERGNAVVRAVAAQSSTRHRDTNDPRARQAEAAMEAAAFAMD